MKIGSVLLIPAAMRTTHCLELVGGRRISGRGIKRKRSICPSPGTNSSCCAPVTCHVTHHLSLQAATSLKAAGVSVVITASANETYRRNALNNGLLLLEVPRLVAHLRQRFDSGGPTMRSRLVMTHTPMA
jgi:hypothetical protein